GNVVGDVEVARHRTGDAVALRLVHRRVRRLEENVEPVAVTWVEGHADRRADTYRFARAVESSSSADRCGDLAAASLSHRDVDHTGHVHVEPGATRVGDQVAAAGTAGETLGARLENLVAGVMPVRVVDSLEAVEVEQEEREAAATALGLVDQIGDPPFELAAV